MQNWFVETTKQILGDYNNTQKEYPYLVSAVPIINENIISLNGNA